MQLRYWNRARSVRALGLSALVFFGIEWLSTIPLIATIMSDPSVPLSRTTPFVLRILLSTFTDNSLFDILFTACISILIGINATLMIAYIKKRSAQRVSALGSSFVGTFVALLGLGCAACGSLLSVALAALGAGSLVPFLPFATAELKIVSVLLLSLSLWLLFREINKPDVC